MSQASDTPKSTGVATLGGSPLDLEVTKDAMARRIAAGDISQSDLDAFKRSYKIIPIATTVGTLVGIPVWFALRRRVPPPPTMLRFAAALSVSTVGMFLGFTVGGAAAAYEVHHNIPDAKRKMLVIEEVIEDSRRALIERRAGIPAGTVIEHRAGVAEQDRFITLDKDGKAQVQSGWEVDPSHYASHAGKESSSAWDKLRNNRSETLSSDDELASKQAQFDAMLDRERQGGSGAAGGDKWK